MVLKSNRIFAFYNEYYIRVYQAFNSKIAFKALNTQNFSESEFNFNRTTWIKPSFLWMMYRSGWGSKTNQNTVLAIDITHQGFKWAVMNSCATSFDHIAHCSIDDWHASLQKAPVLLQWDPARDINMQKQASRTIQLGLRPAASKLYSDYWIVRISNITDVAKEIHETVKAGRVEEAQRMCPLEREYFINF